jgi:hypothetical protein
MAAATTTKIALTKHLIRWQIAKMRLTVKNANQYNQNLNLYQ